MKKILLLLVSLLLVCGTAGAQNLLKNLGERAKNAVENNLGNKVEDGVNKALDGVLGGKNKDKGNDNADDNANRKSNRNNADNEDDAIAGNADDYNLVAQDAKSDFVRGSLIMFEDDMKDEQVGEFPSKWDLVRGNAEIAVINGQKCIALVDGDGWITPLVKGGIRNYLGDVFTVEYDMLFDDRPKDGAPSIELDIMHEKSEPEWE